MRIARVFSPLALLLILAPLLGPPAAAQEEPASETPATEPAPSARVALMLDPAASKVTFVLGATLHDVEGSLRVEKGRISFDPATGAASGRVVVDATSGDTGNDKRDRDMHAKVLESERFPNIVFTAERIEGELPAEGGSRMTLHGKVEIHGTTQPLSIPADVRLEGDRVQATGSFQVPYVDWGMKDPSKLFLRVAKFVDVTVEAVGRLDR